MQKERIDLLDIITHQLMKISTKMVEIHSNPKDFGCGQLLFPAEVHTLDAICKNPQANITEIASILGVTKGAVSQMISKLESKGLLIKKYAPGSDKQRQLFLTDIGKSAQEGHERYHNETIQTVETRMSSLSMSDLKKYREINSIIEGLLKEIE